MACLSLNIAQAQRHLDVVPPRIQQHDVHSNRRRTMSLTITSTTAPSSPLPILPSTAAALTWSSVSLHRALASSSSSSSSSSALLSDEFLSLLHQHPPSAPAIRRPVKCLRFDDSPPQLIAVYTQDEYDRSPMPVVRLAFADVAEVMKLRSLMRRQHARVCKEAAAQRASLSCRSEEAKLAATVTSCCASDSAANPAMSDVSLSEPSTIDACCCTVCGQSCPLTLADQAARNAVAVQLTLDELDRLEALPCAAAD
ncbi:hypothetical protein RI367_007447 [Sorochytrium milnesiophthora]